MECGARKREGERGKYSEGHARTHGESSAGCGIVVPFTLSRLLLSSEDLGSGPVSVRFRSGFGPVSVRFRSGFGPVSVPAGLAVEMTCLDGCVGLPLVAGFVA